MTKVGLAERLRYKFHNSFAQGTAALIGWLGLVSFLLVVIVTLVVKVSGAMPEDTQELSILHIAWLAMLRTMDPGTMGGDSGDGFFMFMMLVVTFGGIFIVSALVGVINNGIEAQIDELRKGRSLVCEEDHTVVLGWSPQVFSIVKELAAANESEGGRRSRSWPRRTRSRWTTSCATRSPTCADRGSCAAPGTRSIRRRPRHRRPNDARSVIVLAPEGATNPDSHIIKTILALDQQPESEEGAVPHRRGDPRSGRTSRRPSSWAKDEGDARLHVEDILSRITVQTCRQSGSPAIYTELLDFGGDEIYMKVEPSLAGKTFGEALSRTRRAR
jgi:hypothetical protein